MDGSGADEDRRKAGCHLVGMIRLLSWVEVHKARGAGKIRRL